MPDPINRRLGTELEFLERRLTRGRGGIHFENFEFIPKLTDIVVGLLGLRERGEKNALDIATRHLEIPLPIPREFDGYTLLHLSDLHLDGLAGQTEALIESLAPADLCVMTGDYRFDIKGPCDAAIHHLESLVPAIRATDGVVAILGNHDFAEIGDALSGMGVTMLSNAATHVERDGASLWIAGVDDPHFYGCEDLDLAFADVPDGARPVFLAHSPELIAKSAERGAGLYLCGHTHGGQIGLPVLGAPYLNARARRRYCIGAWKFDGMAGYTHSGCGASGVGLRFNCPPEIALITLRAT